MHRREPQTEATTLPQELRPNCPAVIRADYAGVRPPSTRLFAAYKISAILGLRALFFLISGALERLRYLGIGLAFVLGFVGIKMLVSDYYEIPTVESLVVVLTILAATLLASWLKGSGKPNPDYRPDRSRPHA